MEMIKAGDKFASYAELMVKLEKYQKETCTKFFKRDSRSIGNATKRVARPLSKNIKFYDLRFCCIHGGKKFKSESTGQRKTSSFRMACPAYIHLGASVDGQSLVVRSLCESHNHEINLMNGGDFKISKSRRVRNKSHQTVHREMKVTTGVQTCITDDEMDTDFEYEYVDGLDSSDDENSETSTSELETNGAELQVENEISICETANGHHTEIHPASTDLHDVRYDSVRSDSNLKERDNNLNSQSVILDASREVSQDIPTVRLQSSLWSSNYNNCDNSNSHDETLEIDCETVEETPTVHVQTSSLSSAFPCGFTTEQQEFIEGRLQSITSAMETRLSTELEALKQAVWTQNVLLQQIADDIQDIRSNRRNYADDVFNENVFQLPLQSLDELNKLALDCTDTDTKCRLVKYLANCGGKTCRDTTYNIMVALLSNSVATKCNWRGVNGKFAFGKCHLRTVICDAVRRNADTSGATDENVKECIKNWLSYSGDRDGGRQRRKTNTAGISDLCDDCVHTHVETT